MNIDRLTTIAEWILADGWSCRWCGHVPTEKELDDGKCPVCWPMTVAGVVDWEGTRDSNAITNEVKL